MGEHSDNGEKVLITGGTGLVGQYITPLLKNAGYQVAFLSRRENLSGETPIYQWDPTNGILDERAFQNVDHIIHLAGAGIADKRWTEARKKLIIDSRILGPDLLLDHVRKNNIPLKSFISASGISVYGTITNDQIYTENDPAYNDFPARCVEEWEAAVDQFEPLCRVVKLRIAVVLALESGALPRLSKPIKMGMGAALGSGKQWVPWIHIQDTADMFLFALQNEALSGAYNAIADEHITNRTLTHEAARALGKKIWAPNVPGFLLKLMYGKMSSLVLEGSRASNEKIKAAGFQFQFPTLREALEDLYQKSR